MSSILLHRDRLNLDCTFSENIIPCLEFTMEFQSNKLIYQKEYTKRQQIIYLLIHHLHDIEGWEYRKISNWLNQSGIKTLRGKNWFSSSVISVLKRKHERDLMNEQIRNQHFPSKVSKFEVNYYIFDWIESTIVFRDKLKVFLTNFFMRWKVVYLKQSQLFY